MNWMKYVNKLLLFLTSYGFYGSLICSAEIYKSFKQI